MSYEPRSELFVKEGLAGKGICRLYVSHPFSHPEGSEREKIIELLKNHGV